jgi:peptidyl-prolyl cis-trans isomerase B (cyclophilin B)
MRIICLFVSSVYSHHKKREVTLMKCIITTEGFGDMVFTLYPEHAPITTANFAKTAREGFYDGLAWCRIVEGYVIQGGSPDNDIMTDSD